MVGIPRLNRENDPYNWLSMRPSSKLFRKIEKTFEMEKFKWTHFGELNEENKLHGRGFKVNQFGTIHIGCFENSLLSTGNYIIIYKDGDFEVGERYIKDGERMRRCTRYMLDGEEEQYGY